MGTRSVPARPVSRGRLGLDVGEREDCEVGKRVLFRRLSEDGFPGLFRVIGTWISHIGSSLPDRGETGGGRTGVGASSRSAAPSLRYGPSPRWRGQCPPWRERLRVTLWCLPLCACRPSSSKMVCPGRVPRGGRIGGWMLSAILASAEKHLRIQQPTSEWVVATGGIEPPTSRL